MGAAAARFGSTRSRSGLDVFLEVEGPSDLRHGFVDRCEWFAIRDLVPDVEDAGLVDRVLHLDDFGAELFVAPFAGLLADFLTDSTKKLGRLRRWGIGPLAARRELHDQLAVEHHPDPGIHDVEANALRDPKLPGLGLVNFDAGVGERLLNILNPQGFLPPMRGKTAFRSRNLTPSIPGAQISRALMLPLEGFAFGALRGSYD